MPGRSWFSNKIEPGLGELEGAYRKHYFSADKTQSIFGLIVYNALLLYFIRADYIFFGLGWTFQLLLTWRLVFLAISIFALILFRNTSSYDVFEKASVTLLFMAMLLNHAVNLSRPRDYMDYVAIGIVSLFMVYFVFPLRIKWRFSIALLSTMFEFHNLNSKIIPASTWVSLVMAYLMANLIGLFISGWYYSLRRYNFSLLHRLQNVNKKLERMAMRDSLTGAKNRRYFLAQGKAEMERSQRYQRPMTVALIDMDNFKSINDAHGHMAGDQALISFVSTVNANVRRPDVFARIGGDEFVLLMPETSEAEARDIVGRLHEIVRERPLTFLEVQIQLSFTAGLAQSDEKDSILELIDRADKNLYQEKSKRDKYDSVPPQVL